MRIVAGLHRGRRLLAPQGQATRPTSDRLRQALFDMLWHAPWSPFAEGRAAAGELRVLDAFAGTGALGLEALSRGAAHASFIERDRAALAALRANIAACREEARALVIAGDATRPPRATAPCALVFLDPPYGKGLVPLAAAALAEAGWIAPGAILCAEMGREEAAPDIPGFEPVAEPRSHGAATLHLWRDKRTALPGMA